MRNTLFFVGLSAWLVSGCGAADSDGAGAATGGDGNANLYGATGGLPDGSSSSSSSSTGGMTTDAAGGSATGGSATGGSATGGTATGGTATGGTATGGTATGGSATGGTATGGTATGGTATGGTATGGTATGGAETGGSGTGGNGNTSVDCSRDGLSAAVDAYFEAIQAHDPALVPGGPTARYTENSSEVDVGTSLWATAGTVTYRHSILDTQNCNTFTFAVSSWQEDGGVVEPIVMGARLKVEDGSVTEVEAIITRDGDWLFNAESFQRNAEQEGEWPLLELGEQGTRAEVRAPGDAYFDNWMDTSIVVPAASNCRRLEGSMYAPCGALGDAVGVGFGQRHYVIDVDKGAVALVGLFGGEAAGSLDVHMFRVVSGEIQMIHTLTVMHDPDFTMTTGWPIYQ